MAKRFNTYEWYMSGFSSQEDAEAVLAENTTAFNSSFDPNDWEITSSVIQGPYGWKAQFKAVNHG